MLSLRELSADDAPLIARAFAAQGWDKPEEQYRHYYLRITVSTSPHGINRL